MKDGERQMETYRKIRKPMPPMEKVIKPKVEFKRERFDWRKAIEDDEDYSIKGGKNA
jgi:hypothetical protein